jgi:hypothetical protein
MTTMFDLESTATFYAPGSATSAAPSNAFEDLTVASAWSASPLGDPSVEDGSLFDLADFEADFEAPVRRRFRRFRARPTCPGREAAVIWQEHPVCRCRGGCDRRGRRARCDDRRSHRAGAAEAGRRAFRRLCWLGHPPGSRRICAQWRAGAHIGSHPSQHWPNTSRHGTELHAHGCLHPDAGGPGINSRRRAVGAGAATVGNSGPRRSADVGSADAAPPRAMDTTAMDAT